MRADFGGKDKSTCKILIPSQSIKGITFITWCTTKITIGMKQKDKNTKATLQLFLYKDKKLRIQTSFNHSNKNPVLL